MHPREVAICSLSGLAFDMLGGLFLAYDLLGERQRLLRFILRFALYGILFGSLYGICFGPKMAMWSGIGLGSALAFELERSSVVLPSRAALIQNVLLASYRSLFIGIGFAQSVDQRFGLAFFIFCSLTLSFAYLLGFSPTQERDNVRITRLNRKMVVGSLVRGLALFGAGIASTRFSAGLGGTFDMGIRAGLVAAGVGLLVGYASPTIEITTDRMERRNLGLLGILILVGVVFSSVQYWVELYR